MGEQLSLDFAELPDGYVWLEDEPCPGCGRSEGPWHGCGDETRCWKCAGIEATP